MKKVLFLLYVQLLYEQIIPVLEADSSVEILTDGFKKLCAIEQHPL